MDITKAFFRYIRGELLNGFYIRKLNLVANGLNSLIHLRAELLYWMKFQFETTSEAFPIRHADLVGIAQIGGILNIRGASSFLRGWFRLSESYLVGAKNRSERGLLQQDLGSLVYMRTELDDYPTDISTIATSALPDALRMSLIPPDAVPVGYVWGDAAAVLLETGMVDDNFINPTPPDGYLLDPVTNQWYWPLDYQTDPPPIYAPWYGNQYLPLANNYPYLTTLPDAILLAIFEAHQEIKYNGLGLKYLFTITERTISDLITDLELELLEAYPGTEFQTWYYKLSFTRIEENFTINDGWGRFSAWVYFIESKYPFIQFNESGA